MRSSTISRFFAITLSAALTLTAASLVGAHSRSRHNESSTPGHFDYYLMSLSWSPTFCETHQSETAQCGAKKYGFVLHGLWPQYNNGRWPEHCATNQKPDEQTVARMLPLMPSHSLIEHEWQTHGACTGLDPARYFELAEQALQGVTIPKEFVAPSAPPELTANEVQKAFIHANPLLDERMISVECRNGGVLEEVHICIDKDNMSVKACGGRVRNSCRAGKLTIPAVR